MKDYTSQSLASVEEVVGEKRVQQFLCSPNYKKEILAIDSACLPSKANHWMWRHTLEKCTGTYPTVGR